MTPAPNQTAQSAVIGANTPAASANLSFTNSMSSFTATASVSQQTIVEAAPTQQQQQQAQQQQVTTVVATAVAVNTQQSTNAQSGSMSKSAYDSLAPLNLPSKPIYYVQENTTTVPSLANLEAANSSNSNDSAKSEDSRLDEKAKLESILLTSMNSQCQMPGGSMSNNSQYSTNNKLIHNTQTDATMAAGTQQMTAQAILQQQQQFQQQAGNRFTANQWPPRMPMRPLPATYRCGICKKPGHPKNMCPDAVNNLCFYLVLYALTLNLFVLLSINFQFKIIIIMTIIIKINVLINKSNNNIKKNGCFKMFLRTKQFFATNC